MSSQFKVKTIKQLQFMRIVVVVFVILLNFHNFNIALTLNSVLDLNETLSYLVNKTTNQITEPKDYIDFENIYTPNETYKWEQTSQGRNYHIFKGFDFANYYQTDYWHYTNKEDLLLSAQPVANKDLCAKHLKWLEEQLNDTTSNKLFMNGQEHINLMTMIDSFGRPEAATFYGHLYWLGSHYECVRTSININRYNLEESCFSPTYRRINNKTCQHQQGQPQPIDKESSILKTRYCIGKARDIDWPNNDNYKPKISHKIGLCLPEACETLSFEKHKHQLDRLMRYNMPDYIKNRMYLDDIYCLPDPKSPIRSWSLSSRIFITINALWIIISLVSTAIYSCYKRHQRDLQSIVLTSNQQATAVKLNVNCQTDKQFVASKYELSSEPKTIMAKANVSIKDSKDHLSTNSYKSSSSTLALWLSESPITIKITQCLSIKENLKEFQQPPLLLRQPNSYKILRINLNALDSIKCLCCILVIFGHIIFIHMQHLNNYIHAIELSNDVYPKLLIAFFNFVDTFFIISGMLTAYFVFKRFNVKTFSNPLIWIYISVLRLLRLSPIYILVLWFAKTVSVHLYDGPLWDYGTDKNSIKGLCINDHWWKSIIYFGNVGTMQPLCILPAWSIIVDSQYSLIVPPMLYLILKNKRFAYVIIVLATIISTAKMSFQLANQSAVRTSDMAKIRLHVYPAISRFAAEFYNTAWNRIGPVAIGIFGGHMLYLYDIGKFKQWPWFMRGFGFKIVLLMHLLIFILPTMANQSSATTNDSKEQQQNNYSDTELTIFLLSNATIKPIWSLINTIFLLRLVTDLRRHSVLAKLASHNLWHCLGKLCFVSYLIHYEIILILLKSRQDIVIEPNWPNALREFSLVFLISTILAYVIHIIYEAPINKLITLIMTKPEYTKGKSMASNQGYDGSRPTNITINGVHKNKTNSEQIFNDFQINHNDSEDESKICINERYNNNCNNDHHHHKTDPESSLSSIMNNYDSLNEDDVGRRGHDIKLNNINTRQQLDASGAMRTNNQNGPLEITIKQ